MKVAFFCVSLRGGGTERIVSRFANHLASQHDVSIITLVAGEPFYELKDGVAVLQPPVRRGAGRIRRVWGQVVHCWRVARRVKPDVCCVFGEDIAGVLVPLLRLAGGRRVLAFFRGNPQRSLSGVKGLLHPLLLSPAARIVVQSSRASELLKRRYRGSRFAILPNPIVIPEEVSPVLARPNRILYVASLGRNKNQAGLIRAFAAIQRRTGWELWLVGDGPDRRRLTILAHELGVQHVVRFLGERKDVYDLMSQSQVFAFPSLSEGFPNALGEAMAHGCACISYDCPCGPSEIFGDQQGGLLIESDDEIALAAGLQALIDDPALRARLSQNARQNVPRFREAVIFEQLNQILSGVDCESSETMVGAPSLPNDRIQGRSGVGCGC